MKLNTLLFALLISTGSFAAGKADVVIRTDTSTATISRHIYGQFSEHLGQCIYGGIWVEYMTFDGESPMANLRKQNGREKPWSALLSAWTNGVRACLQSGRCDWQNRNWSDPDSQRCSRIQYV